MTAYSNPVGAFNRYWYANNNPYKFMDPDGRLSRCGVSCDDERNDKYQDRFRPDAQNGLSADDDDITTLETVTVTGTSNALESGDLAGYWNSKGYSTKWADIGKGMWSPETASPKFRLLGQLTKGWLFFNMAMRDGGSMPFLHSVEAGFIGKEVAAGVGNYTARTGRDPGLFASNLLHYAVFKGHGLPSSTYGGTPFGYAPTGGWKAFGDYQSIAVNAVVGYCEGCDP